MQTAFTPMIDPVVWLRFPEYRALSITAREFHPTEANPSLGQPQPPPYMDGHLEAWREAFRRFGANPKKTSSSVEALWKRVAKTGSLPAINPLVDLYNSLSVRFGAPFGGEDADQYQGLPRLTSAMGTESFDTARDGTPVIENPEVDEIIWRDDAGVTCRRWNWRQCKRTALTESSTNLWFVIDRLPPMPIESLWQAGEELLAGLRNLSPDVRSEITLLCP